MTLLIPAGGVADEQTVLRRSQPLEPHVATESFRLKEGFSLQLTAAEPLVTDPVAGAFDEDGRLYIVEMNDYPYTDKATDKPNVERTADLPIGKVRLLEDTDDDGVFDRSSIFARDLSWPTGIAVYKGGVFVAATPDLWYLKDSDGDGQAEIREKIFTGFRKFNVQAVVNNLIWGLDHHIYGAGGTNGGRVASGSDASVPPVTISRNDFRFTPDRPALELLSGGARFGNTFDDWGNRFICNIRNPIQHIVLPQEALARNPALNVGSPLQDVAVAGDQIPVFRASPPEPWRVINAARLTSQGDPRMPRSEKNAHGFMTSACGVTVYRGDAYPPEFRQQVLLAEVAGNLIHRQKIEPVGVTFTSQRIDEASEFVTSTDNWFRPVNFLHAPDGTLYVLDMYRETIEHPWSMPDDLKAMLDLENGRDRGRIYRLTPPDFQRRKTPRLSQATTAELVSLLEHPNAWHRETAHRLLYEKQPVEAVKDVRTLMKKSTSDIGRLCAMWTLEGFGQLNSDDLTALMQDSAEPVREHAVALSGIHAQHASAEVRESLLSEMLKRASDDGPRVRFQLALSLGQFEDVRCTRALVTILRRDADDSWTVNAALSSSRELGSDLFEQLLKEPAFMADVRHLPLLRKLITVTGVRNRQAELNTVTLGLISLSRDESLRSMFTELLPALDDGLRRAGTRLSAIWQNHAAKSLLDEQVELASAMAQNTERPMEERLNALRLVSCGDISTVRTAVTPLLTTSQAPEIQTAAVRALAAFQDDQTANDLLSVFGASTPAVQYEVIEAMASHPDRVSALLRAIEEGHIAAAQITPIRRTLLLNHADETLRMQAQALLGADRTTPRQQVIEQFQNAVRTPGVAAKGRMVFARECAACHRMGTSGFDIGPSLITVQHRTAMELLTQILDPNREVAPSYMQFVIALKNGEVLAGMIAEETPTSLTLKQAQNKQDVILRENVSEIRATGLSLMPEGFEKKLTAEEITDLIAFLQQGTE